MTAPAVQPSETQLSRLGAGRTAWLCTVRADGRPHLAPIWYVFVENRFWFVTGIESVKARNIAAEARVSVGLEVGDDAVVAEGDAFLRPVDRPAAVAAAFLEKYDWDITLPTAPRVGVIVLIELTIDKWLSVSD